MNKTLTPERIQKAMLEIKTAIALVAYVNVYTNQDGLEVSEPLSDEQKVTIENYKTASASDY